MHFVTTAETSRRRTAIDLMALQQEKVNRAGRGLGAAAAHLELQRAAEHERAHLLVGRRILAHRQRAAHRPAGRCEQPRGVDDAREEPREVELARACAPPLKDQIPPLKRSEVPS